MSTFIMTGTKTFTTNSVTVEADIWVESLNVANGMINGVNVVQIVDDAVLNGEDGKVQGNKTFDNISGKFHVVKATLVF